MRPDSCRLASKLVVHLAPSSSSTVRTFVGSGRRRPARPPGTRPRTKSSAWLLAAGSRSSDFGVNTIERLADVPVHLAPEQVEVLGRRASGTTTWMLSSARELRGTVRSARWSARAPGPRTRAAAAGRARSSAPTCPRPTTMNWSTMTSASLTKSPNCASHSTSASFAHDRVRRTRTRGPRTRSAGCRRSRNGACALGQVLQRVRTRSSVSWSTSTAWRWLNVPRRVSCPVSRTGVPSMTQRAEGERLAHRPVDARPSSSASRRRCSCAASFGCGVNVLGPRS